MITYITAFIFYTLAMVGILLVGFVVYKKMMINPSFGNKGMIKVLDNYPIAPKKTLMVVKVGNEKFLLASGAEHTTFLAKLDESSSGTIISEPKDIVKNDTKNIDFDSLIPKLKRDEIKNNKISINDVDKVRELVSMETAENTRLQKLQKRFNELYDNQENVVDDQAKFKADENKRVLNRILQELSKPNFTNEGRN